MINKLKQNFVPVLILLGFTSLFSLSMLFCPHSYATFGHDAGIFAYVGFAVTKGVPLYTGAWDNKGPLLYLIDALGITINYRYGIFILEFISLFITLIFMYKTAKLFASRWVALISSMLASMPLIVTLQGGNLSEEWALPFTVAAFYFISKFYCNNYSLKKYEMMTVGACIAAIILLRLNIIMFIAVAVLGVIITLLNKKQFKNLFVTALFAFIGFFIFVIPFVIYLIITGSLSACLDAAYFSVVGSFSEITPMQAIANVSEMVFNFISSGGFFIIILFVAIAPFYFYKNKGADDPFKTLLHICFWGIFATLLGNSVSGASQMHYFMTFIPVMLIPVVWFLKSIYSHLANTGVQSFARNAVIAALAFFISINSLAVLRTNILTNLRDDVLEYFELKHVQFADIICQYSSPEDTVQIFGSPTVYYRAQRLAASNYFYYANGRFSEEAKIMFADKIFEDIKKNDPKIIAFTDGKYEEYITHVSSPDEFQDFLKSNYRPLENSFDALIYVIAEDQ